MYGDQYGRRISQLKPPRTVRYMTVYDRLNMAVYGRGIEIESLFYKNLISLLNGPAEDSDSRPSPQNLDHDDVAPLLMHIDGWRCMAALIVTRHTIACLSPPLALPFTHPEKLKLLPFSCIIRSLYKLVIGNVTVQLKFC